MRKVLLTGASGRIGAEFFAAYNDQYEFFLTDLREPNYLVPKGHQFVKVDLSDLKTIDRLFLGQDTVVHLAGVFDLQMPNLNKYILLTFWRQLI